MPGWQSQDFCGRDSRVGTSAPRARPIPPTVYSMPFFRWRGECVFQRLAEAAFGEFVFGGRYTQDRQQHAGFSVAGADGLRDFIMRMRGCGDVSDWST